MSGTSTPRSSQLAPDLRDRRGRRVVVDRDAHQLATRRGRAPRPGAPCRPRRRCRCWSSTGRRPGGPSPPSRRPRRTVTVRRRTGVQVASLIRRRVLRMSKIGDPAPGAPSAPTKPAEVDRRAPGCTLIRLPRQLLGDGHRHAAAIHGRERQDVDDREVGRQQRDEPEQERRRQLAVGAHERRPCRWARPPAGRRCCATRSATPRMMSVDASTVRWKPMTTAPRGRCRLGAGFEPQDAGRPARRSRRLCRRAQRHGLVLHACHRGAGP